MSDPASHPLLRLRIVFDDAGMIGPGKAELLARIDRCGSIAAAGREMGMSYKRAWQLVGLLNGMFHEPLVDSTRGGRGVGGAVLTETGKRVLQLYHDLCADAFVAASPHLEAMMHLRLDPAKKK